MTRLIRCFWPMLMTLAVGCAAHPGTRLQGDVRVFEREQTPDRLVQRGSAFAAMGDTTRAQQYFEAALDNGADPSQVIPLLVTVCVRDGRYRLAVEYARRDLARKPNDTKMHFVLGTLYAGLGEVEAAQRELELAVRGEGGNAELQYALAVLLRDQRGDLLGADHHFREYLRLSPAGDHAEEARAAMLLEVR